MKKLVALLLLAIPSVLGCSSSSAAAAKVRIVTLENPPYNYVDDKGQVVGSSTEVVRAIMKKLGQDIPIEELPFEQAYALVQKDPNVALYSTARVAARENLFQWVGPIGKTGRYLYAKKGSGIKLNSIADIKGKTLAGAPNEGGNKYCVAQGAILVNSDTWEDALPKVMDGRADLVGAGEDISYEAKKAGINPDSFERLLLVESYDLYIAFNKGTPAAVVQQWQQAFDSIKK